MCTFFTKLVHPTMDAAEQMSRALRVLTLDPDVRAFLEANDPKALEQAQGALETYDAESAALEDHLEELETEWLDRLEHAAAGAREWDRPVGG